MSHVRVTRLCASCTRSHVTCHVSYVPPLKFQRGFTLVETLVAASILAILAVAIYLSFSTVIGATVASRAKVAATLLANEQLEVMRNLPYSEVGLVGGVPAGVVTRETEVVRDGYTFAVVTAIRNIDDPYDGTIESSPADTAPADYKLAQVTITCAKCADFAPVELATTLAPLGVEGESGNGALFVRVIDAAGEPVSGATVRIVNGEAFPAIDITDITDLNGRYQLVDVPPGELAYMVTVSKSGYSSDITHAPSLENPDPVLPPATVAAGQGTSLGFSIDKTSAISVNTLLEDCSVVGLADFSLWGEKLIGGEAESEPVYKYLSELVADGNGSLVVGLLEWDIYRVRPEGLTYNIVGTTPAFPFALAPGTNASARVLVRAQNPAGLLVRVRDLGAGTPVADAEITLARGLFSVSEYSTTTSQGGCEPEGSVYFAGLESGGSPYELTIVHPSYQTIVDDSIVVDTPWQEVVFSLSPQ